MINILLPKVWIDIQRVSKLAFSIGIASLFGKRVPAGLKIFLMALAIN